MLTLPIIKTLTGEQSVGGILPIPELLQLG